MAKPITPVETRFFNKFTIDPASGCWIWVGASNGVGYGKISVGGQGQEYAHRVSYEIHCGPIPDGMQIDHLCRNPSCVNPNHLEPVTNRENTRRGLISQLRPPRARCGRGHDLSVTAYRDSQGHTQCRECLHIRQRAYHQRKKER